MSHAIKDWVTSAGFRAVIIRHDSGYLCGYVGVTKAHPYYELGYSEEIPGHKDQGTPEYELQVHGGVTYAGGSDGGYPAASKLRLWWFGFDCAHGGDTREKCNETYVTVECERLADELAKAAKGEL